MRTCWDEAIEEPRSTEDPKPGFVYLGRNGDLHKIGITRRLEARLRTLKFDEVICTTLVDGHRDLERSLHARFKHCRIPQTEYFRLKEEDVSLVCSLMQAAQLGPEPEGAPVGSPWLAPFRAVGAVVRLTRRTCSGIHTFFQTKGQKKLSGRKIALALFGVGILGGALQDLGKKNSTETVAHLGETTMSLAAFALAILITSLLVYGACYVVTLPFRILRRIFRV